MPGSVRTGKVDLGTGYALVARLDSGDLDAFRLSIHEADGTELDFCEGSNDETASHPITVSYAAEVLRAEYGGCCLQAVCSDNGDPFVYLGSTVGTVHFDNFVFEKYKDTSEPSDGGCEETECPPATIDCNVCLNGVMCEFLLVDFPVMVDGSCSECESIPSFILQAFGQVGDHCLWQDTAAPLPCGGGTGGVRAVIQKIGSDYFLSVVIEWADFGGGTDTSVSWRANLGPGVPDCTAWDRVPLTFYEYTNAPAPNPIQCDATGTIAYVSTLC